MERGSGSVEVSLCGLNVEWSTLVSNSSSWILNPGILESWNPDWLECRNPAGERWVATASGFPGSQADTQLRSPVHLLLRSNSCPPRATHPQERLSRGGARCNHDPTLRIPTRFSSFRVPVLTHHRPLLRCTSRGGVQQQWSRKGKVLLSFPSSAAAVGGRHADWRKATSRTPRCCRSCLWKNCLR